MVVFVTLVAGVSFWVVGGVAGATTACAYSSVSFVVVHTSNIANGLMLVKLTFLHLGYVVGVVIKAFNEVADFEVFSKSDTFVPIFKHGMSSVI